MCPLLSSVAVIVVDRWSEDVNERRIPHLKGEKQRGSPVAAARLADQRAECRLTVLEQVFSLNGPDAATTVTA